MSKRVSGAPRHPRSPVAKAVRTPAFRMRVVPDKRWQGRLKDAEPPDMEPQQVQPDTQDDVPENGKD